MQNKINVIALAAGISTLLLIAISLFVPWWQFTVGNPAIASVNVSPVNLNLALLETSITVPLTIALNVASALSLASGGIIMLIYSLRPNKSYSKKLLGFAYKKPLFAVILFVISLISASYMVQRFSGFSVPLTGSGIMMLPEELMPQSANIGVTFSAGFGWPFYLAIAIAVLCIVARVYHRKVVANDTAPTTPFPDPIQ